jgi:carbon-monoxide dehydrogenase large subunit
VSASPDATADRAGRFVGQSVRRREDPRLLTGGGRFVADVTLPGTLHAVFVRGRSARARIAHLDTAPAASAPGVVGVFTADDVNTRCDSYRASVFPPGLPGPPGHLLAPGDVRYVGHPVAVVVATDRYLAEDAAELVEVVEEPLRPVLDHEAAADDTELVHPELGTNLAVAGEKPEPGLAAVMASAAHVVTETFHQQRQTNAPMETRGVLASWVPFAERMEVWISTQSPHETAATAARVAGLERHQVVVHHGDVGGAFGQKVFLGREEQVVFLLARLLGRPLKWIEDRHESLMAATQCRHERIRVTMALDERARIVGVHLDHLEDYGAYVDGGGAEGGGRACNQFPGPYRIPLLAWQSRSVYTNTVGRGAYRGPWMIETVAREQMMDRVAGELGLDPLELRRRNVLHDDDLPHTTATGLVYDRISPARTLEQAAELVGYDTLRDEQRRARERGRYLGIGISLYVEPTARGFGFMGTDGAVIRVEPDGKVTVYMGSGGHGQGLETTVAQVVADELGVTPDDVTLVQGAATPYGIGTGGSRSAVITAGTARSVSNELRGKVLAIAAELLEAAPVDVELDGGRAWVRGTPSRAVTMSEIAAVAYFDPDRLPVGTDPGLEHSGRWRTPSLVTYSNAAQISVCEVDPRTGVVALLRHVVSEDCGEMINPMLVEGQIAGGVAQGIAGALYEEAAYDDDGNPLATTFLDYLMPTAAEVPPLAYGHVVTPSAVPGGHKGMGEGGAIGAPAAVCNAVNDALAPFGVLLTRQPLSPPTVLAALEDGPGESAALSGPMAEPGALGA